MAKCEPQYPTENLSIAVHGSMAKIYKCHIEMKDITFAMGQ